LKKEERGWSGRCLTQLPAVKEVQNKPRLPVWPGSSLGNSPVAASFQLAGESPASWKLAATGTVTGKRPLWNQAPFLMVLPGPETFVIFLGPNGIHVFTNERNIRLPQKKPMVWPVGSVPTGWKLTIVRPVGRGQGHFFYLSCLVAGKFIS